MTFHLLIRLFYAWVAVACVSCLVVAFVYWREGRRIQRHGDRPWN